MKEAIYLDFGKSAFETYMTEISMVYAEINYFLKNIRRLARPKKVKQNLINWPGTSRLYPEPYGTTLVIGAWNYPYQLSLIPLTASVAAGNTCIVKPSELPANSMHVMAEMINQHFPSEYIHVISGGIEEAESLLQLPFDKIFFTGSPRVGKLVYEAAAKHLTPVTLELGGKSPVVVTASANLAVAARRIVWGKFLNAGQTCIAPDYLLVEESVREELMDLLKKELNKEPYLTGSKHYVQIVNSRNFDRLTALIDPNKVAYGGRFDPAERYIEPTILQHVSWSDPIMENEIFGPILPVLSFSDLPHALQQIAILPKPLSAYLFTSHQADEALFLDYLSFGGGCVNDTIVHVTNPRLPFGGVGHSGIGSYHGVWGFKTFSHQKAVMKRRTWGEPSLKYPPYSDQKLGWIKRFFS